MDHCKSLVNLVSIDRVLNGDKLETLNILIGTSHSTGDNEAPDWASGGSNVYPPSAFFAMDRNWRQLDATMYPAHSMIKK